jgi:alkaline phosphatase
VHARLRKAPIESRGAMTDGTGLVNTMQKEDATPATWGGGSRRHHGDRRRNTRRSAVHEQILAENEGTFNERVGV